MGWTHQLERGKGREHTSAGQKEDETGSGKCFQRSFEEEEELMHAKGPEEIRPFRKFPRAG